MNRALTPEKSNTVNIISASRRTDIPRFYPRWFAERRKAGVAEFRNVFGGRGSVSLRNEDVLGYLFWTRLARPFAPQLRVLRDEGIPFVFQYTINGYGREIEPHSPARIKAIEDFHATSSLLPSNLCIQWRYDPIVLSNRYPPDWHLENFTLIAASLKGATRVVNTSFIEPYKKAIRRVGDASVLFRPVDEQRHKSVAKSGNICEVSYKEGRTLLEQLAAIAQSHDMELRMCSNPEWDILPAAQCCGIELFEPYGEEITNRVNSLRPGPSRASCRCVKTVDIGMDNTCPAGCKYCYVVTAQETAMKNFKKHQPVSSMLR